MLNPHIQHVPLEKAYRLLTHGPTVLVSSKDHKETDVMAAAWACALEFDPAKVTVVLDKSTKTRQLIENSGYFALQIPNLKQLELVYKLGTTSKMTEPNKLEICQVKLFQFENSDLPVVADCSAWLLCELIPEPHIQQAHDLFIGKVIAAYADNRVFSQGRWHFEDADEEWRTIHHVAGGHFYSIGKAVSVEEANLEL